MMGLLRRMAPVALVLALTVALLAVATWDDYQRGLDRRENERALCVSQNEIRLTLTQIIAEARTLRRLMGTTPGIERYYNTALARLRPIDCAAVVPREEDR